MRFFVHKILIFFSLLLFIVAPTIYKKISRHSDQKTQISLATFDELYDVLSNVKPNLEMPISYKNDNFPSAIIPTLELKRVLTDYFNVMIDQLARSSIWSDQFANIIKHTNFFVPNYQDNYYQNYLAYMQKLIIDPGSHIAFHGDMHGDIRSLMAFLKKLIEMEYLDTNLHITKDNFYMLFLGDYVDKGNYGIEVVYTVLRLKNANPDRVFLVRGNHEDYKINKRRGFASEVFGRYAHEGENLLKIICRIYDFMPVVMYLGVQSNDATINFLQCCHGGMEPGLNPGSFLTSRYTYALLPQRLDNEDFVAHIGIDKHDLLYNEIGVGSLQNCFVQGTHKSYTTPLFKIGYLWSDFLVDANQPSYFHKDWGYQFGNYLTQKLLNYQSTDFAKIKGVFRAHQHDQLGDPMMDLIYDSTGATPNHRGVAKLWIEKEHKKFNSNRLWDGIVCTFSVGPESAYFNPRKDLLFDAFGILRVQKDFDDWRLDMYQLDLYTHILKQRKSGQPHLKCCS